MGKMIEVEGYKAFRGTMRIIRGPLACDLIGGDWLYRPDTCCWYCSGCSYPAEICQIVFIN